MTQRNSDAIIDITHPIKCIIINWERALDHVEYVIEVTNQLRTIKPWRIQRRYGQFLKLNAEIEKFGIDLEFPPKKIIGNTKEPFIKRRMLALQAFLDVICLHPVLYTCPPVVSFLESFTDSDVDLHEWILLSLRDKREWLIEKPRKHCGWRPGKVHYEVKYCHSKFMLSGVRYGPDRFGTVSGLNSVLQFLRSLQCSHLNESVASWATDGGIIYVRSIFKDGTLRDQLCKSDWKDKFLTKYRVDNPICSLGNHDIRFISRQLLETLTFLNAVPVPYLDIHAGNIVVTEFGCELIDLDQVLSGQPSLRRPSLLNSNAIDSLEDMFVFSFGEFLFELFTGFLTFPMHSAIQAIASVPPMFQPLLSSILLPEVRSLPRLQELIDSCLFIDIPVVRIRQRKIRIPSDVKEVLDGLCNNILERYKKDLVQVIL
ncbi:unnamed protein product [Thelazia callipaeda]|uniref:PX domain-containing protein n=1 Tax=Thelazia callipaeda TaxID=103827 RepID=A0A158RAW2_THECL|nr:unnamed protein product [Thelazia callipaeda]